MLIITLPDGSQVAITVTVVGGLARTHVSHRARPSDVWTPIAEPMVYNGWISVEDAVLVATRAAEAAQRYARTL